MKIKNYWSTLHYSLNRITCKEEKNWTTEDGDWMGYMWEGFIHTRNAEILHTKTAATPTVWTDSQATISTGYGNAMGGLIDKKTIKQFGARWPGHNTDWDF